MPTSIGHSSAYAGDMHVVPAASNRQYTTPRGHTTSTNSSGVPTTTRTYAVTNEPRTRPGASLAPRESSRTRRSTVDSTSRPPVIVTTTHGPSGLQTTAARSGSPIRDDYRASDGQFYSQPASSIRSRSAARPYHSSRTTDDYGRPKDRRDSFLSARDADAYRNSRPSVVYPSDPRHSAAAIDYGDEGYQYTRPGELVKYDLDQPRHGGHRRQESIDRGYYRPSINYHPDQRNYNVNTSHDLNRHSSLSARPYDGRGGPPPSTRGFDKINQGYDKRDVPPSAPAPPPPPTTVKVEGPGMSDKRDAEKRPRPLSLHQNTESKSSQYGDYHRSRDDERLMRDGRGREYVRDWDRGWEDSRYDSPRFQDERVPTRGFGIRAEAQEKRGPSKDRRLESRLEEPRKRSDEEVSYLDDRDREGRRYNRQRQAEDHDSRPDRKREDERTEKQEESSKVKSALSSGLGQAASAVGLSPPSKAVDKEHHRSPSPNRRYSPPRDATTYADLEARGGGAVLEQKGPTRSREAVDRDRLGDREHTHAIDQSRGKVDPGPHEDLGKALHLSSENEPRGDERPRPERRGPTESKHHSSKDVPPRAYGEHTKLSGSDSDETKRSSRRKGPIAGAGSFDPKDTTDLKQLKEQLAALEVKDELNEGAKRKSPPPTKERSSPPKARSPSLERTSRDSRGSSPGPSLEREIVPVAGPRHVRLVSPERDKTDDKPLRGILKQPRASFPEQESYVREGVAPPQRR